jgi:hypothetical protein
VLNVGADRCCVVAGRWYIASATFRVLKVANADPFLVPAF